MKHDLSSLNKKFSLNIKSGLLEKESIAEFQKIIWQYYKKYGRVFSWRQTANPYHIFVSEIMLQQTQTSRVEEKYQQFIKILPDFKSLAGAPQKEVLRLWQGLGYNRRALALQKSAQKVIDDFRGVLPNDPEVLVKFQGIGPATASSICAFAFNKPTIFIETNIRAVFIHYFFNDIQVVHDKQLMPLIKQAVDEESPREWYYALMDYGVMLKKKFKNPSRKSKHYARQSIFKGSDRQIRGAVLKLLLNHHKLTYQELLSMLRDQLGCSHDRADKVLNDLENEKFVQIKEKLFTL